MIPQTLPDDVESIIKCVSSQQISRSPALSHMKRRRLFHIRYGGFDGGGDLRVIDVMFGTLPYNSIPSFDSNGVPTTEILVSYGARLRMQLFPDGVVGCLLFPSESDELRAVEDLYFYRHFSGVHKLTKSRIARVLRMYFSYALYTSIDGNARWIDRLRVRWLKLFYRPVIDKSPQQSVATQSMKSLTKWVLTIGLSGSLVILFDKLIMSNTVVQPVNVTLTPPVRDTVVVIINSNEHQPPMSGVRSHSKSNKSDSSSQTPSKE